MHTRLASLLTVVLAGCAPAAAATGAGGFSVQVLVGGRPLGEYAANGTRYVEAVNGKEYAVRLCNPLGVRTAVALSIDGLNSIDARRTTAQAARKWVLEPYECVTIAGWQTDAARARRFYFTSEDRSYARWLGRPDDIGLIAAAFFRERTPEPVAIARPRDDDGRQADGRKSESAAGSPSAPAPRAAAPSAQESNDYAATGIGRETAHPVQQVHLDLEDRPAASISIRYEYRTQLVKLGILPPRAPDRLTRREQARGFDEEFCPVP
jgi:hypothetical protein